MNRLKVRRLSGMTAIGALALLVLVACGDTGGGEGEQADVTRVPVTSEAAGAATAAAQQEAATPASPAASPMAATTDEATPAAVTTAEATPVAATPMTTPAAAATPVAATEVTAAAATPAAATPVTAASPAAETVEVVSRDIFFEPDEVSIPADTDVTFVLPNEGAAPHNFSIDALGIDIDIAPGETQEIVVNAPAGTYEYYCNVPGHKEAGMVGTLTVE